MKPIMNCSDESLRLLLREDEQSGDYREAARHVDSCPHCQQRIGKLAAEDDEWREAHEMLLAGDDAGSGNVDPVSGHERVGPRWQRRPTAWTEAMARQLLSPPSHPEMLGRIGRYEVERLIGTGGMGVVFKAFDSELNRPVAVKLLTPYLAGSGAARKRFAREARAAAAVVHEHVVAIHNVESDGEVPFLVMQYVPGESLQSRLDREGPLGICEILRIGTQIASGLAAAHAQGLVHRDVKPSNVLLEKGVERSLLTDFGLARAGDDAGLTLTGHHPGTPQYMSPEQARGEALDGRSDLFSLGCVLYEMATGVSPFRTDSTLATLRRIVDEQPAAMPSLVPELPPWFCHIVERLLSKDPAQRFASASEVSHLLEQCLSHLQQPTSVPLPASLAPRATGRRSIFNVTQKGVLAMICPPVVEFVDGKQIVKWRGICLTGLVVATLSAVGFLGFRFAFDVILGSTVDLFPGILLAATIPTGLVLGSQLRARLAPHSAGRRSIFNVTRKGVFAMLGTIGMTLLGMVLLQATEAPDISGQWNSEEWGTVVLEAKGPGQYEGTFGGTDKTGKPATGKSLPAGVGGIYGAEGVEALSATEKGQPAAGATEISASGRRKSGVVHEGKAGKHGVFAPYDSTVIEVRVENGQTVKPGDILLVLRSDNLDAELLESRNIASEAKVKVDKWRTVQSLSAEMNLPIESTRKAEHLIATFEAQLAGANENTALIQKQIDALQVRSDIDGVVATLQVKQNLLNRPVRRGDQLIEIQPRPVDSQFGGKIESISGSEFDVRGPDTKSGKLHLKWSRLERRFNGTWGKGSDRRGAMSLRLVDKELRGGWTTDKDVQLESGTPLLGDLLWARDATKKQPDESRNTTTIKPEIPANGRPVDKDRLLNELRERDRQFSRHSVELERRWNEDISPKGRAEQNRFHSLKLGVGDPGIPEGLPDLYQQPHRIRYIWTGQNFESTLEILADLETAIHPEHGKLAARTIESDCFNYQRLWDRDKEIFEHNSDIERLCSGEKAWEYLLPSGFGFTPSIHQVLNAVEVAEGYVLKGLISRPSATIGTRKNCFELHLDKELILRKAVIQYHVYDYVIATSGRREFPGIPPLAERAAMSIHYIGQDEKRIGDRGNFQYEVIALSKRLSKDEYDLRVNFAIPKGTKLAAGLNLVEANLQGLPGVTQVDRDQPGPRPQMSENVKSGVPVAETTTLPDWVVAWDFRDTLMNQRYAKMRISRDGKMEAILPGRALLLRTQLSPDELSELVALVVKNPQAESQPLAKVAEYSPAVAPTPDLFDALKKLNVRSEIVAVVHDGGLVELDLNNQAAGVVDFQLHKLVGLAAIGGSKELSRLVEVANRELTRKFPDVSNQINQTHFYYGMVDHRSGEVSVWFSFNIDPESKGGQMALLRISQDGQPALEQVVLPKAENPVPESESPNTAVPAIELPKVQNTVPERKLPPVDGPAVYPKLADKRYVQGGVPLAEQTWPMPPWGEEKDGLSAGIRVIGDARIGGEVKVELWVRNSGEKDVKFSKCHRADVGLWVIAKDKDGKEHHADITSFRGRPVFSHWLLPAGHGVKLKEFSLKFGSRNNDELERGWVSFDLPPGDFKLYAKWSDTTSRAAHEGEWTGNLTTGEVDLKIVAADEGTVTEKPAANPPGGNMVQVPDDQYVKTGFPLADLAGEGVAWNDLQNGLSLGHRITGDEWRILGKEVKVELWVRNQGRKDVKFQLSMRPDIGLTMKMKDEKGRVYDSKIVPTDVPPFGEHRQLSPGHALKVKEFTVSLIAPENDVSGIKGHYFAIDPGAYKFHCELDLPGFSATGTGGKQLTPAAGEWTGKLTTGEMDVRVVAPDAPAATEK